MGPCNPRVHGVRTTYLEGRSIAVLARDHDVSRGAIRTAIADFFAQRHHHRRDPRPGAAGHPRHAGQGTLSNLSLSWPGGG